MIQQTPIIIDIAEPASSPAQRVVDVLVGSFGLAGAITIAAIVLGGLIGGVMLWLRSRRGLGDGVEASIEERRPGS